MTPTHPFVFLLALACALASPAAWAAPVTAAWILKAIARPVPSSTAFVELRPSPLLSEPVRTTGHYRRPAADVLVREVISPRPETTTLRADAIAITRNGKTRRFDATRAPALAHLLSGFSALLAGNQEDLSRHYRIASSGTRSAWILRLEPIDPALAAQVRTLEITGSGAELRCIVTHPTKGAVQHTLLARAATSAHALPTADLPGRCRPG